MTDLPDVNVWLALVDENHVHHANTALIGFGISGAIFVSGVLISTVIPTIIIGLVVFPLFTGAIGMCYFIGNLGVIALLNNPYTIKKFKKICEANFFISILAH